ncbi:immunity 49 family protein [Pseudoalteromonas luteoviolacea]|uniref:immunity 49 family protein n=1 Tax=Pseudoalteromonas luteoviolacea TaxID=43657 RepID=UPI001B39F287|nr:immunity 49 family protein [Pseudoalteromonas luteoviolacea]MBQ4878111.1 immunity 49 family protein [Pseudoalteromonas luteoviolacea]MBQ4907035.1 immunity 49 family protein [Pseudoalteromonas luteoviolacea]
MKHHYGDSYELDVYQEFYQQQVCSAYFIKSALQNGQVRFDLMSGDSWEYQEANQWINGFDFAVFAKRPHSEARWFLDKFYHYHLTHFKRHMFPNEQHELRLDEVSIIRPGERLSFGIDPISWCRAVYWALAYNDMQSITWLDQFEEQSMDMSGVAQIHMAEFNIVKAILNPQERDLVAAIKAYMQVDITVLSELESRVADDVLLSRRSENLPRIDCLLSVFCHEDEQTYQQKMLDALDKFAQCAHTMDKAGEPFAYFALDLVGLARVAYSGKGYLVPDHPYLPQWLITEDLTDITPPPEPDSIPTL